MTTQLSNPAVAVRPARPDDPVAGLVFDAARSAYCSAAGSEECARAVLKQLWTVPGHSASYEHALVAELDGKPVGVLIAFPARDQYRLHFALLRKSLRYGIARRLFHLAVALPALIAASPRPPSNAYYVATIAVARRARRRGVGSTLAHGAERVAADRGFPLIVAHTGTRHLAARQALERFGARGTKGRARGYSLYVKAVSPPPLHPPTGHTLRRRHGIFGQPF